MKYTELLNLNTSDLLKMIKNPSTSPALRGEIARVLLDRPDPVDWKKVSKSKGYKSLKAAYVGDVTGTFPRDKRETYAKFMWVICRAQHYAKFEGVSLSTILNNWENQRSYWWINYYQDCNFPKLSDCHNVKPRGLNAVKAYYKQMNFSAKSHVSRTCAYTMREHIKNCCKVKSRWDAARKKRSL